MTMATYDVTVEERNQVEQALAAYCRGLDRFDREIALSAFSPNAALNYSGIYVWDAPGFMVWVWPFHEKLELNVHRIANVFIDRNRSGDLVSECYVTSTLRRREGEEYVDRVGYSRYVDRWEATDGHRLTIVERDCLNDLISELRTPAVAAPPVALVDEVLALQARRDRDDASYRLFLGLDSPEPAASAVPE